MSSMTLKQFMTRGMEKDAADYIYNPETREIYYDPKATAYGTNSLLNSPVVQYFFNKGIDENKESLVTGLNKWIPRAGDIAAGMAVPPDTYRDEHGEAMMQQVQSLVEYLKPIVADDAKYAAEIKKIEGAYGKEQAAKVKEVLDGVRSIPGLRTLYNTSPDMFNAIADKHIYRYIMKQFGMDPSKVGDYVKDLNSYDMNQHLPGMAAAFGIPFGIGALMGKPGWGLLLGLLGAGGYGYYQYNKMQGQRPEVENQMLNNAPGTDNTADTSKQENQNNSAPAVKPLPEITLPPAGSNTQPTVVPNNPNASAEEIMNSVFPNTTAVNNTTRGNNALTEAEDAIDTSALDAEDGGDQEMSPKPVADTPANNISFTTPPTNTQYVQVTPRKATTTPPTQSRSLTRITVEVPPHQETKKDEGHGLYPNNGLAVSPFSFS